MRQQKLIPKDVSFILTNGRDLGHVHDEERMLVTRDKSPKRRRQFLMGRQAAHLAIQKIDRAAASLPILRDRDRMPSWPGRIVGSITHCDDIAAAAIGSSRTFNGIGLDLQPIFSNSSLKSLRRIAVDEEIAWINESASETRLRATMIFCAKEALFKCVYPQTRKWFGLRDALLSWNPDRNCFVPKLLKSRLSRANRIMISVGQLNGVLMALALDRK